MTVERGVRVGIDPGEVRVGVAASDPDGLIATPVRTVDVGASEVRDLTVIAQEVALRDTAVVYVGLPRHLNGSEGAAGLRARSFADALAQVVAPVPVRLVDERMSTVSAHRSLRAAGRPGRRHRAVVDQAAAVIILQSALDRERSTGARAGEPVEVSS